LEHEKASLNTQLTNLQREKDQKVQELEREIERLKEDILELQNEKEGIAGTKETVIIIEISPKSHVSISMKLKQSN